MACVRSSKQIGAETFVKNNGERIIEKRNRGGGINVWRIGLSEHTKEEDSIKIFCRNGAMWDMHGREESIVSA